MKPRGIPIAQIESAMENDDRIKALFSSSDRITYYALLGAYLSIVLRAWASASREVSPARERVLPPDLVGPLIKEGLLDAEGAIPEAVFEKWVGSVLDSRRRDADRKRTPPDSAGVLRSPGDSNIVSSPLLSSGDIRKENGTAEPARDDDWTELAPVIAELTGRLHFNRLSGTGSMLVEDAEEFGTPRVIATMRAVAGAMEAKPDLRALAFGVRNALRPPPDGKVIAAAERAADEKRASDRRFEATQRYIAAQRQQADG
jgi:hypothetical protein